MRGLLTAGGLLGAVDVYALSLLILAISPLPISISPNQGRDFPTVLHSANVLAKKAKIPADNNVCTSLMKTSAGDAHKMEFAVPFSRLVCEFLVGG